MTHTYYARIKLSTGSSQVVTVEADNTLNAKSMIETQYGKGSIITGPTRNRMS